MIALILNIALIGYYQVNLIMKTNALEKEIVLVDEFLTNSDNLSVVNAVDEKQGVEAVLQLAYSDLINVTQQMAFSSQLDEMLLDKINAQVPEGLFIVDLSVSDASLSLKGYALEYAIIAQFAHNLRNAGGLNQVLIPTITEGSGNYNYTVTAIVETEAFNEN